MLVIYSIRWKTTSSMYISHSMSADGHPSKMKPKHKQIHQKLHTASYPSV